MELARDLLLLFLLAREELRELIRLQTSRQTVQQLERILGLEVHREWLHYPVVQAHPMRGKRMRQKAVEQHTTVVAVAVQLNTHHSYQAELQRQHLAVRELDTVTMVVLTTASLHRPVVVVVALARLA